MVVATMSVVRIVRESRKSYPISLFSKYGLLKLTTARNRPKRIKPPPDPEIVKSVIEKLEAMRLGTYTSPSAGSGA